jgi:mannose-6-phosphate isomerase-like protein (cupin superfamily)
VKTTRHIAAGVSQGEFSGLRSGGVVAKIAFEMPIHDTVDYATILSGEIWLILDDGAEVQLTPGDCVVQNGTQHAWHNRTPEPCVMAGVTVGAKRQG